MSSLQYENNTIINIIFTSQLKKVLIDNVITQSKVYGKWSY